jgi:DNA sulfur modification protein DndB
MIPRDLQKLEEGEGYEFVVVGGNGGDIGKLTVKSTLVLFPADGQHRVAAIKEVLKKNPRLANVSVPVVLLPFRGRQQVRQLFSDLNQHAKVVNKSTARSFETRDPVAVMVKHLEKLVPLFVGRVNHASNSLPASSDNVITVNTLYEGTEALLGGLAYDVDSLWDRSDQDVQKISKQVGDVWISITNSLPGWSEVGSIDRKPSTLRDEYVFAHGIGWQAIALAAATMALEFGPTWLGKFETTLKSINWSKANPDWQGACMVGDRMNNTGPGVRATAGYILKKAGATGDKASALIEQYEKSKSTAQPAAPQAA